MLVSGAAQSCACGKCAKWWRTTTGHTTSCWHHAGISAGSTRASSGVGTCPSGAARHALSHTFRHTTRPVFGRIHLRERLIKLRAAAAGMRSFHMRYAAAAVGAREIPAPQWTKTTAPDSRDSSMNLREI